MDDTSGSGLVVLRAIAMAGFMLFSACASGQERAVASGGPEMTKNGDRQAVAEAIECKLSTDADAGMRALREATPGASEEFARDLLAVAWRQGQASSDTRLRRQLVGYLLGVLHDGTPFLRTQALKFLQDFSSGDFDAQARTRLQEIPLEGEDAAGIVRLIGIAGVRSRQEELQRLAGTGFQTSGSALYAGVPWAACLALARMGDASCLQRIVEKTAQERDLIVRTTQLFADLAYTRQPAAFDALRGYLRSDARLPQLKDTVPGASEALYAAAAIAGHVEGSPVAEKDLREEDVTTVRRWAESQRGWRIKD